MSWVKLDDKFFLNGKIREASDPARLLYFSGLCFSAQAESDGVILTADLAVVAAYARTVNVAIQQAMAALPSDPTELAKLIAAARAQRAAEVVRS